MSNENDLFWLRAEIKRLKKENQRLRDILTGLHEYEWNAGLEDTPTVGPREVEWKHEETN